mmetsp:Transcript_26342/g.78993  ORF Transcript_26342/g.78993 Transcript_26342/m.78993 type:complete len:153 (+) Transcript_26342:91-549(+)
MQADPEKWDDSALIDAVSKGIRDLKTAPPPEPEAAPPPEADLGEDAADDDFDDAMAAADARFASLLQAAPARARTAVIPVKDETVGEYGEWHSVDPEPPAPVAPPSMPAMPGVLPAAGADSGLGDVLASWYYAGYYLGRFHGEQEALQQGSG